MRDIAPSTVRSNQVAVPEVVRLDIMAQIIDRSVIVSDTTVETTMAKVRVSENSRNRRPTIPSMKIKGVKARSDDRLMTARETDLPGTFKRRLIGRHAMLELRTFSIMTMASSTTKPTESPAPSATDCRSRTGKPHAGAGAGQSQWHGDNLRDRRR